MIGQTVKVLDANNWYFGKLAVITHVDYFWNVYTVMVNGNITFAVKAKEVEFVR